MVQTKFNNLSHSFTLQLHHINLNNISILRVNKHICSREEIEPKAEEILKVLLYVCYSNLRLVLNLSADK